MACTTRIQFFIENDVEYSTPVIVHRVLWLRCARACTKWITSYPHWVLEEHWLRGSWWSKVIWLQFAGACSTSPRVHSTSRSLIISRRCSVPISVCSRRYETYWGSWRKGNWPRFIYSWICSASTLEIAEFAQRFTDPELLILVIISHMKCLAVGNEKEMGIGWMGCIFRA